MVEILVSKSLASGIEGNYDGVGGKRWFLSLIKFFLARDDNFMSLGGSWQLKSSLCVDFSVFIWWNWNAERFVILFCLITLSQFSLRRCSGFSKCN